MGISGSIIKEAEQCGLAEFRSEEWNKVGTLLKRSPSVSVLHSQEDYEPSDIYESVRLNLFVEEYLIEYASKDSLKAHLQQVQWRNQCSQLISAVLIAVNQKQAELCGSGEKIRLYLQHVPLRLNKLNDIPFPQNLYVLRETLLGFKEIYSKYKELVIREEHICVNYECKVKVWMNQNLASGDPEDQQVRHPLKTEAKIVQTIVEMISKNTDHDTQVIDITAYLKKKQKKLTFRFVLESIQEIAKLLKIKIPEALESCKILFSRQSSFEVSRVVEFTHQIFQDRNDTQISDSTFEDHQIPTLNLHSLKSDSTSVNTFKLTDSCSTQMMTPQKASRTQRYPFERHHFPEPQSWTPMTSRDFSLPFAKRLSFNYLNLRENKDSLIKRIDYHEPNPIAPVKFVASLPQKINIDRHQKIRSQSVVLKKWSYWRDSREESSMDPYIAADLELLSLQMA